MSKRNKVDETTIEFLKNKEWLYTKLVTEQYSCSRLAKELGTSRTTVEKYRVLHQIEQPLSQKELTTINYQNKKVEAKQKILEKRKQTNLKLYGAENTFQSHKEKIIKVMQDKYGVNKPLQSPEILNKKRNTMKKRYGVEHAMHNSEIYQAVQTYFIVTYGGNPAKLQTTKHKRILTSIQKYGVEHAMMKPEIAEFARQRFLEEYDTPEKLQSVLDKAKKTCKKKYGVSYSSQKHLSHDTLAKLNDKDWLVEQHHTHKKTMLQIGRELGCWDATVARYLTNNNVEIKYYFESAQQRELSDWLVTLGIEVKTNVRNLIDGELDIYLPQHNLAIEYCGVFWHCDVHSRITPHYHLDKLTKCREKGIRLITLYEDEWLYKQQIVKQKIESIVGKDTRSVTPARKCTMVPVSTLQKRAFFDENHVQGNGPSSVDIGLFYQQELVACMSFIELQQKVFILNRYATKTHTPGGFTRLLKYFQNNHQWEQIISFADLRWSDGDVYDKAQFTLSKVLSPDYRYVLGNKTFHKFAFRRKQLPRILGESFDSQLTEVQNMNNAGYYRIWNCGLNRYVLNHP